MIVATFFVFLISLHAQIICGPTDVFGDVFQKFQTVDKSSVVDFGKKIVSDTLDLPYMTAQELVVRAPGTDQELVINWGFGGSGHIFSPIAWVPVQLRSGKGGQFQTTPFSLSDLGKALVQDKVMQQVQKNAQEIPLLQWLSDAHLSPLKLCCLKLFLLAKDFSKQSIDQSQVQTELLRLLVRLSLTDDLGIIDASQPFSFYMPELIKAFINKHIPYALSTIDTVLGTLVLNNKHSGTIADFTTAMPRRVYASSYLTENAANIYFQSCLNFPIENFVQGKKDMIQYDDVTATNTPADMPVELKQAALTATMLPQLIRVTTAKGQHFIACVTDRLDMLATTTLTCAALLATIKEYAVIRNVYLRANPDVAQKLKDSQEDHQRNMRRLHAFDKTEAGQASRARITEKTKAIINEPIVDKAAQKEQQHLDLLKELGQELDELITEAQRIEENLAGLKQAVKNAPSYAKAQLLKRIKLLEQEASKLEIRIKDKKEIITKLEPETLGNQNSADSMLDDTQNLETFRALAASLKQRGEPVSPELEHIIQELEAKISSVKIAAQPIASLDDRIAQRARIAQVYLDEASLLHTDLSQMLAALHKLPADTKRKIDEIKFSTLEKPLYDATINNLKYLASQIIDQNEKMLELSAYRYTLAVINAADMSPEDRAHVRALEIEVGCLLDDNSLESNGTPASTLPTGAINALLSGNQEIKELLHDLSGDNKAYADIKARLFAMLSLIVQKSDHIKEYATGYRYVIEKSMPDFLPYFQNNI